MSLNDPQFLVSELLKAETIQNNNLIEILGLIKPSSATHSSKVTSIVRGLYTKNSQLLKLLNSFDKEIAHDPIPIDVFKTFVNEFVIWLENDGLVIFQKYFLLFPLEYDYDVFATPMLHCANYISFMLHTNDILRNPFIKDKLSQFAGQLNDLLYDYETHCEKIKLNNISFDNVKVFAEAPNHKSLDKVSCFFKLDQIVERTKNEELYLISDGSKKIEMILLDLSHLMLATFNALALVEVPQSSNGARSLIYPPFRINELTIDFNDNTIILKALKFSKVIKTTDEIVISGKNERIISDWSQKLSSIFPNSSSPIDKQFLIKPDNEFEMCGLGINTFDYPSSHSSPLNDLQRRSSFKDLISMSPGSNLKSDSLRSPTEQNLIIDLQPPVPRQDSTQSVHSVDSSSSLKSQYDRSLDIIHKTLSNHSLGHSNSLQVMNSDGPANGSQFIHIVNRKDAVTRKDFDRPISSQAEIYNGNSPAPSGVDYNNDEELDLGDVKTAVYEYAPNESLVELSDDYQKKQQNRFSSVPDLSTPPKTGIYQLSTGSAVDINNFGQSHNPSFSIHNELSSFTDPRIVASTNNSATDITDIPPTSDKKTRRKSLFSIFKRQPKPPKKIRNDSEASIGTIDSGATLAPPCKPQVESNTADDKTATNSEDDTIDKQPKLIKKKSKSSLTKEEKLIRRKKEEKQLTGKKDEKQSRLSKKKSKSSLKETKETENSTATATEPKSAPNSISKPQLKLDTSNTVTSFSPAPKSSAPSSALPSPFALPASTSTYFFKGKNNSEATLNESRESIEEEKLAIPQDLKDMINSEDSVDFYISPSTPKSMKVSRWKQKYGKWEMLTISEMLFLKIVADYNTKKYWLIFFKEEYDKEYNEVIDKPILLMDIDVNSSIRQSSALDIQITAKDSIEQTKLLIMIRCASGLLCNAILSNFTNILGVSKQPGASSNALSSHTDSSNTINSSVMDTSRPSASSTFSSLASAVGGVKSSSYSQFQDLVTLDSLDITNANIINNPNNNRVFLLNKMTVRLQLQMETYEEINNPSSWKILSMYALSIYMISDHFTHKNYYNLIFENIDSRNEDIDLQAFNWLICEDDKFERVERIGKAGMLIRATPHDIFMIECKGKKEFRTLYELF